MISAPFFVVIVTLLILSLVFGGSSVVCGRAGPVDAAAVDRACLGRLPSRISSGTERFGDGSGCRV